MLDEYKLTEADFTGNDIEGLDDDPLLTPTELKERFDSAAKDVIVPKFNAMLDGILGKIYPVGAIYMSVSNINPSELFGGTWAAWGTGRVPVGVNTAQTEFNTVEKTGGETTHLLTAAESGEKGHNHIQNAHGHSYPVNNPGIADAYGPLNTVAQVGDVRTTVGLSTATNLAVPASNASNAHNNLQPYITCYMWKRTV